MQYILLLISSLVLSLIFTPVVRKVAFLSAMVSYPRPDRWHKHPTALLGGISIYAAFIVTILIFGLADKKSLGLLIGATFLFLVGLADDKLHFRPYLKLFFQIIASGVAVLFGIIINLPFGPIVSILITMIWIIGITNSFNLLDNIDGLASGIAAITGFMLFLSSMLFTNNPFGLFGLIIFGACLGFLPYNFNPAKIFMGDSGSMFLGYTLAVVSVEGAVKNVSNLLLTIFIPLLILTVPIFDTIFVMIVRKLTGRKIFVGGQDHTSHHLVSLGLSPRKTVLVLYTISVIFGSIGLLYTKMSDFVISVIAFLLIVVLMVFGMFLFEGIYGKSLIPWQRKGLQREKSEGTVLNSMFLYKRRIVEVLMDFIFVFIAYSTAYYLRFDKSLLNSNLQLMNQSVVWVVLIKMSVFFTFGLYRGVWRYISISDFFTMFKVVTLGSVFSILFLTFVFRFENYSRAVFFVDWLLLLFLIMGSRFLFRIIGEFFSSVKGKGRRILIFGAGDLGDIVMREIKRNKSLNYSPVGFVDDDKFKHGTKIQGVEVLGSRKKIKELISVKKIEELVIAIPTLEKAVLNEICATCKENGIPVKRVRGVLENTEQLNAD